jgi:hypothetical protein
MEDSMAGARLRRAGVLSLSSVLCACGHSGGGGDPLPALAAGPFHSVGFRAIHGAPDTLTTNVGTLLSNGVDSLTDAGSTENVNGTISADPGGPVIPFTLSPAGVLSFEDASAIEHFRGGVALGGDLAAVAAVLSLPGSESSFVMTLKKGTGMSDAALNGAYHSCSFGAFVGGSHFGFLAPAVFDGIGGVALDAGLQNNDGAVTAGTAGMGSYGVAADGTLLMGNYQGGVGAGGDYAIVGGGIAPGSLNDSWIFIRKAAFADPASLAGNYTIVGIGYSIANSRYYDFTGLFTANGDGHCTVTLTSNEEGVISTLTDSSTYTVGADGTLEWNFGLGGGTFRGAVSEDGRIGMIGGGITTGSDPTLALLLRR